MINLKQNKVNPFETMNDNYLPKDKGLSTFNFESLYNSIIHSVKEITYQDFYFLSVILTSC